MMHSARSPRRKPLFIGTHSDDSRSDINHIISTARAAQSKCTWSVFKLSVAVSDRKSSSALKLAACSWSRRTRKGRACYCSMKRYPDADGWYARYGEQFGKHGETAHNRSLRSAKPSSSRGKRSFPFMHQSFDRRQTIGKHSSALD